MNCEATCRQWRDILLIGTTWKRLFGRSKDSSLLWRRAQIKLEKFQPTFRTDQYRGVCKDVLQVKRNWRSGNFTRFIYEVNRPHSFRLMISEDYVVWNICLLVEAETYQECAFLDTESMEITKIPLYFYYDIMNGMLIRLEFNDNGRTVDIWNPKFNWTINEEEDGLVFRQMLCSGSGLIVCSSTYLDDRERIEVWKMGNPPILLRTRF